MKSYYLFAIVYGLLWTACSHPQIKLSFHGFTNDTLTVCYCPLKDYADLTDDSDPRIIYDTLVMKNGVIRLLPPTQSSLYVFSINETPDKSIRMVIDPDDHLQLNIKRTPYGFQHTATGSPMAEGISDYMQTVLPIDESIDSLFLLLKATPDDAALSQEYNRLFDRRRALSAQWIRTHADNPAAGIALRYASLDSIPALYALLSEEIRHSALRPLIEERKENAERYLATTKAGQHIIPGAEAPDFTLCDPQGQPWSLSQLRGKWVVLDFWGTWCGYCLQGIPAMKKYESQYRDHCTFVSIDCNDSHEDWLAGLKQHAMPWLQLYNPRGISSDKDVSVLYGLKGFPTKFIIHPEGYIYQIVIGEKPEFYQTLDQLFQ